MASIIVVVIIFVLLALAILFICQNGGWQGGCGGNCAAAATNMTLTRKKNDPERLLREPLFVAVLAQSPKKRYTIDKYIILGGTARER